jgi:hypothetical protein
VEIFFQSIMIIKYFEEYKLIKFENHIFSMNENDEIIISPE